MSESEERAKEDVNWRDRAVRRRLGFALEHDTVYKDITFLIGQDEEKISAHKLILRLSSLVFENLIRNHEQRGLNEIKLPNVTSSMFQRLLKFIYTDELEMHDFLHFLQVAKDFGFYKLAEQSQKIMNKTRLTFENAVVVLDIAKGFMDSVLEQAALEFIRKNAKDVLNSREFCQVSYSGLCQILMDDELYVDEFTVFAAVVKWATFQCKNSGIAASGENIRDILKDAKHYIRYNLMTYDQIISSVKDSEILTDCEYLLLLNSYEYPTATPLEIATKPRGLKYVRQTEANELHLQEQNIIVLTQPAQEISDEMIQEVPIQENAEAQCMQIEILQSSSNTPRPTHSFDNNHRQDVFHLLNCSISFHDILNAAQFRFSITKIILHNVSILNAAASAGRRLYLPNLESFLFLQDKDLSTALPDKSFMDGMTTKDLLFFEKSNTQLWSFMNLWSLGVQICIYVKGIKYIELDPSTLKLVLTYPVQEELQLILRNLSRQYSLKTLSLTGCQMVHEDHISTRSIETLILRDLKFLTKAKARKFINKCHSLKNLSLSLTSGIPLDLEIDLKGNLTLERLCLSKVEIIGLNNQNHIKPFVHLKQLYLDKCTWQKSLNDTFNLLFPNLKSLVIRSKDNCRPTAPLLLTALSIPSLERVAIFRYTGNEDTKTNPNLDLFVPPSTVQKIQMTSFLRFAGVQFVNHEIPDFLLIKDIHTDVWRAIAEFSVSELHFYQSMLNEFLMDSEICQLVTSV